MLDILHPRNPRELQATESGDFFDLISPCQPGNQKQTHANPHKNQCESKKSRKLVGMTRKLTHCCTVSTSSKDTPIRRVPLKCPPRLPRQILHHDPAEDDELRVDGVEDAVVGEVEAVGDFDGEPGFWDSEGLDWSVE
jgi:hypothetical protein